ncbi:MAG: ROK family protein [Thermomicrobiales bacterium]|nr:ROK family protein [Thermomicrobiales bacterium]
MSHYLGIDLGGTTIKFAIVREDGEIVANDRIMTDGEDGHGNVIARMIETAKNLTVANADTPVEAIGVAVPGVIDMVNGISIFLPNLPGDWPNVPVTEPISRALNKPAWLINDVRAFTLAELTFGAARGVNTGIFYAVGTGIGGGVVAHGKLNLGVGGAGGELGHMIVNANGPECGCGNRGCIEAYAAGPAIIGEANRRIVMGETTTLRDKIGDDLNKMVPELVEEAAEEGDKEAQEVLEYAGFHFGLGIAGAISALAPEVVVLGGGVVKPHGFFWKQIEQSARSHCHVTEIDRVQFRPSHFSYEAGVVGAALWSREVESGRVVPAR